MPKLGWNHVDLLTEDMEATRHFYEDLLGFEVKRRDLVEIEGVGLIQHVFFDIGDGQMIAFSSGEDAPVFPKGVDTSINKALGVGPIVHFAFEAGSEEGLLELQETLEAAGVRTRGPEDHEGWCRSVYFRDPNGLQMEACYVTRELGTEEDLQSQVRFRYSATDGKQSVPSASA
jgi:catechol 2,3-dioxygenase-like lactoylglutathione lyase family enzyme